MPTNPKTKIPYHEQIANKLIEQLKQGTAPWQLPWKPGEPRMPHNPVSGTKYKGSNAIWLAMQGREDPRWMTFKQANSLDAKVIKGQHGTIVQYWKLFDKVDKTDCNGKKILGVDGKPLKETIKLEKPKVISAVVFNATQIEGLPELEIKTEPDWQRHERAEKIMNNLGAILHHDQHDNAYYSPSTDSIHMPRRAQFDTADKYYSCLLHEGAHASGASHRLNRDMTGRFGDESYAKEELRAEIASLMIGDELQIGHDFGQHAAYVDAWIKVLQDDPKEILRASRDAEKIQQFVMGLEFEKQVNNTAKICNERSKNQQISFINTTETESIELY
ncbi:ArdC family protein [Parashewanella tropica]|uniref:ArdC family protein n=1 Tax=Parashewanella tropica TaxID=2547970 RepID=UPI00105A838E|nr:zincin-like metallopeptidase domain-containing protein [Parashewanella tropica]